MRIAILLSAAACGNNAPTPPPAPLPTVAQTQVGLTGVWLGTLSADGKGLRLQVHLGRAASPQGCTIDSLDQGTTGTPCSNVVASSTELSFDVPSVHAAMKGTVSTDSNTVTGTWTQGIATLPLVLTRQAAALETIEIDVGPQRHPVAIENIQAVLDGDVAQLLAGSLAPDTGVGVTIGVLEHGVRKVFSYGGVKPDSVFEIGSITKTFTGLALAQMAEQKKVRLDEPVRGFLPEGTVTASTDGAEITLLDLSAQRSGLPRIPDNMMPFDVVDPYANYDDKALYAFMATHGVAMPATPVFGYSNLGVGLLGQALAVRAGTTYEELIRKEITEPLGMRETMVTLSPALTKRLVGGHAAENAAQGPWHFGALGGAGAIRSTAGDMLTYLDAQLHPERVNGKTPEAKTMAAALAASHEIRGEGLDSSEHIALNWFRIDANGVYWHNGATGGFSSFAMFDPANDSAVVVLVNRSVDDGTLADDLATHIVQRLRGKPVVTLAP